MPRYNCIVRRKKCPSWVKGPIRYNNHVPTTILPNGEVGHAIGHATSSTSDVDFPYTDAETEFMLAMDALKRRLGRMPVCWEILREFKTLGYSLPERLALKIFGG